MITRCYWSKVLPHMRLGLWRSPGLYWLLLIEAQTFGHCILCSGSGPGRTIQSNCRHGQAGQGERTSEEQHCVEHSYVYNRVRQAYVVHKYLLKQ